MDFLSRLNAHNNAGNNKKPLSAEEIKKQQEARKLKVERAKKIEAENKAKASAESKAKEDALKQEAKTRHRQAD